MCFQNWIVELWMDATMKREEGAHLLLAGQSRAPQEYLILNEFIEGREGGGEKD